MSDVSKVSRFPLAGIPRFSRNVLTAGAALHLLILPQHGIGAQETIPDTTQQSRA